LLKVFWFFFSKKNILLKTRLVKRKQSFFTRKGWWGAAAAAAYVGKIYTSRADSKNQNVFQWLIFWHDTCYSFDQLNFSQLKRGL